MAIHSEIRIGRLGLTSGPTPESQYANQPQGKFTPITGMLKVGMEELKVGASANKVSPVAKKFFKDPVPKIYATLLGGATVLVVCAAGGPLSWGIGIALGVALSAYLITYYITTSAPFFRQKASKITPNETADDRVKEVNTLLRESFSSCKAAQKIVENALEYAPYPDIRINLDSEKDHVPFGARCIPELGRIDILIDWDDIHSTGTQEKILRSTLFELINITRARKKPHNLYEAASNEKYIDEETFIKKKREYADAMEEWEHGTLMELETVCREIIQEAWPADNPQKALWRSAALTSMRKHYRVFLENKECKTLRSIDHILSEKEDNLDKREIRVRSWWKGHLIKNGHTPSYETSFARLLPRPFFADFFETHSI